MSADEQAGIRVEVRRRSWTGGVAANHQRAEHADLDFWRVATPEERLQGVTALVLEMWEMMKALPSDFRDLLEEFARSKVEVVLVGGYAVAFHGRPRATKDIDLVVRGTPENLSAAADALDRFGAPVNVVVAMRDMKPSEVIFMGQPPLRVDMLQTIDGVNSDELFARAITATVAGLQLRVISLPDLIANKRAAGRPQDLLDAEMLVRMAAAGGSDA